MGRTLATAEASILNPDGTLLASGPSRVDRIDKVREYAAVASIRRYVILESTTAALTVFERQDAKTPSTR